jgi:hypothetical protein
MKNCKVFAIFALLCLCSGVFAQEESESGNGKFKRENIFLGTSLNLGLANHSFNVGLNPEVGYSVTKWLDAGMAFNINYFSQGASDYSPYRYRNFNYGGGPFLRVWPLSFLHLQIQPEYNWTSSNVKNMQTNLEGTNHYNTTSLLVGVGYGTRILGQHYSYVTLMIDVLQNYNSPYRDQYNDPVPVFRAGFGFYLKPKRR